MTSAVPIPLKPVSQRLRHLLGIEPLTAEQILFILDQAKPFQEFQRHPLKKLATLRGKTVALAFFEPSTRTRISFATSAARLGADTMNLQAESSSLKKGESLIDTVWTLEAMKPDGIVIRHAASGAADFIARRVDIPVLNAGDGTHEHPTQALLDALTMRDRQGRLEALERNNSRRHPAQPRGPLKYSSAQQIRRANHFVRPGHVGPARTRMSRAKYPPRAAHRESTRRSRCSDRPARAIRAHPRAAHLARRLHPALSTNARAPAV